MSTRTIAILALVLVIVLALIIFVLWSGARARESAGFHGVFVQRSGGKNLCCAAIRAPTATRGPAKPGRSTMWRPQRLASVRGAKIWSAAAGVATRRKATQRCCCGCSIGRE
jgi:hypothetical protein